jgi:hypothetical protein
MQCKGFQQNSGMPQPAAVKYNFPVGCCVQVPEAVCAAVKLHIHQSSTDYAGSIIHQRNLQTSCDTGEHTVQ